VSEKVVAVLNTATRSVLPLVEGLDDGVGCVTRHTWLVLFLYLLVHLHQFLLPLLFLVLLHELLEHLLGCLLALLTNVLLD